MTTPSSSPDTSETRQQATIHQLHEIRQYLDFIHTHPQLLAATHEHTRNRVRFGHPAPANLDLLTLTDNRVGVPAMLREWATYIRETRNLGSMVTHYRHTTALLAWHTPWIYTNHHQPDKYAKNIRDAHRQLARHVVQSEQCGTAVGGNS